MDFFPNKLDLQQQTHVHMHDLHFKKWKQVVKMLNNQYFYIVNLVITRCQNGAKHKGANEWHNILAQGSFET